MKNYLLYPDCFTADSINQCRFAILKLLGHYNLTPPANISVLIQTNKAADFEIFQPFFKELKMVEKAAPVPWNDFSSFQNLLSGYSGNVLVFHSNGYAKQPLEALFEKMQEGALVYCMQPGEEGSEWPNNYFFEKTFSVGVSTDFLQNPSSTLYASAQNSNSYFTIFKNRKELNGFLKRFFARNEEESTANLVKKAKVFDLEMLENEAAATDKLSFIKRWLRRIRGKNTLLRHYQNKV